MPCRTAPPGDVLFCVPLRAVPPRFYTHHYEQYMDISHFDEAAETVSDIIQKYADVEAAAGAPPVTRMKPLGLSFL